MRACYGRPDKLEHIKPVYAGSDGEHGVDYEQVSFGEGTPGGYGFYQLVDKNQYEKVEYDVEEERYGGGISGSPEGRGHEPEGVDGYKDKGN